MSILRFALLAAVLSGCGDTGADLKCGPGTEATGGMCLPVTDSGGGDHEPGDGPTDTGAGDDSGDPVDTGDSDSGDSDSGGHDTGDDDTGLADTGTPGPSEPCGDSTAFGPPVDPAGHFDVGEFIVQVDEEGEVYALHADDFSHAVFHSAPGSWLRLGDHLVHAEEHQGSFDIDVEESFTCQESRFVHAETAEGSVRLSGVFDDDDVRCADAAFTLRVCESGEGRLAFDFAPDAADEFNFSSIRIRSRPSERIYGMGEQFPHDSLDLNGRQIAVLVEEGGVGRGHPVISPLVDLASPGSAGNEGTTYYAAPHYLTSDLHSIFLKDTAYAEFDFREAEAIEIRLYADAMSWEALYARTPLSLIERFSEYAGRMPSPPEWTQSGAILALARPLEQSLELVDALLEAGTRVAGVWNQTWSGINVTYIGEQVLWNWVLDEEEHPGWHEWVDELEDRDVRALCYINSMFLDLSDRETVPERHLFAEGEAAGYFVKDEHGDTLMLPVTAFDVALLDFTNDAAREWMKAVIIEEMVDNASCSGWMVDFAEALPFEAVLHDGSSAAEYHNRYPVEWMRLNREALEESGLVGDILTFNRAGHTQSPRHSLMFWQGDQLTTWDRFDGLGSAVRGLINGGFSGLALNHSDTGGYTSLSRLGLGYAREAELLKRWGELSAFTSLLRTHEGNQPEANAQVYDVDQRAHFAWVSRVFAGLQDYRRDRFKEAQEWGWPVVRHLWLHYPWDSAAHETDDQFLLGSGFLVAPVLEKCGGWPTCTSTRDVYLPEGEWTHLWSGDIVRGPASLRIEAPMQQPPVFYLRGDSSAARAVANLRAVDVGVHAE